MELPSLAAQPAAQQRQSSLFRPAAMVFQSLLAKMSLFLNSLNIKSDPMIAPCSDERLTPSDRLFSHPEMNTIIHCALGFERQMDIDTLKSFIKNSPLIHHPRFCSLLVRDKSGTEIWRRTEIDIDRHIILVEAAASGGNGGNNLNHDSEKIINDYIAGLSFNAPLSLEKPLWEIHLLVKEKCAVFRIHHALGDGTSVMSMLSEICKKGDDLEAGTATTLITGGRRDRKGKDWMGKLMVVLKKILFSIMFCAEFILRFLFISDKKTVISSGNGMELLPKKVTTAKFKIEDMKTVKNTVANATINDVLLGVISAGLSRYLDHRSPNSLRDGQQLTSVTMVNLRQQAGLLDLTEMMRSNSTSPWGNKFGIILLPTYYYHKIQPLQYVERVKKMIDRKKQSIEAQFSHIFWNLITYLFGSKILYLVCYRILCHATFSISNMMGPKEEISIEGNPITFVRISISSLPQAGVMHMVSYAGRADLQIVVPKSVIPDPEFLAKCFEDSLLKMKDAALASI